MAKSRRQKTLADYAVIALSPALIMLLVGSLVFFLLEATYTGQWAGRLRWILFWFVFASVLVARIAIVEGKQYAAIYGLVLAGATSLVIFKFVDFAFGALCLLGVVWWSTNKLTWDCTLIDESEDASGEGLLQAAGLDKKTEPAGLDDKTEPESEDNTDVIEPAQNPTVWESIASRGSKQRNKPHAPGLWVVYFALAALPLFGVGQLLIPLAEAGRRCFALQLLAVYVAASLALLMTTSFLGLRRYLRQRRMQMPASIVGTWLGVGAVLIVLVLGVAILLPRPNAEYSATAMLDKLAGKEQQASWFDLLGGEGEGQRTGEGEDGEPGENNDDHQQDGDGEPKGEDGQEQEKDGAKGNGQEKDGEDDDGEKGDKQNGGGAGGDKKGDGEQQGGEEGENDAEQGEQQAGDEQGGNQPPPASSDAASSSIAWLANIGKWIIYLLIAIGIGWYVTRNRARLLAALQQLWQQLMSLFGRSADDARDGDAQQSAEVRPPPRPFASFDNPFVTGAAGGMQPAALVIYTFEALEAWAFEQRLERPTEQTPIEFGSVLSEHFPNMSAAVTHACRLYARVAYSETIPGRNATAKLEKLWQSMSATARTMSGMANG
jgi:hypothetical protein